MDPVLSHCSQWTELHMYERCLLVCHLVVLAEQRQGTVLPGRVALGNVDVAVGRLGWGL